VSTYDSIHHRTRKIMPELPISSIVPGREQAGGQHDDP